MKRSLPRRARCHGILLLNLALATAACKRDKPELRKENAHREPRPEESTGASQLEAPVEELPLPEARQAMNGPPVESRLLLTAMSTGYGPLRLHSLQGGLLATQDEEVFLLENGHLARQQLEFANDHRVSDYRYVEGTWPGPLGGTAEIGERVPSDRGDHYEFESGHFFGDAKMLSRTTEQLAPSAWSRGRMLGWRPSRFVAYGASSDALLPEMPRSDCGAEIRVRTIAAMADGAVFAAGFACSSPDQLAVGRWADGRRDGTIRVLRSRRKATPDTNLRLVRGPTRIALLSTTDDHASVWRLGQDGWRELLLPHVPEVASAVAAPDGSLWLLASGAPEESSRAFRLQDDVLSEVHLPGEDDLRHALEDPAFVEPLSLRPTSFGHRGEMIYLAALIIRGTDKRIGYALLEVGRGSATAPDVPDDSATDASGAGSCASPLVVLYAVSATTAPDYDYPATRDAVMGTRFEKSAKFQEVMRAGKRTLVARLASRRAAEELAALIRERVPGSRPAVLCEEVTEVLRNVKIF